jgi:hypothetical protein
MTRIDCILQERKQQKLWSQKWEFDSNRTMWSQWSVLNPPDRALLLSQPKPINETFFKITGNRNRYLSRQVEQIVPVTQDKKIQSKGNFPKSSNSEYGWSWPGKPLQLYTKS